MYQSTETTGIPPAARAAARAPAPEGAPASGLADLVFLLNCYDVWSGPTKSAPQCADAAG